MKEIKLKTRTGKDQTIQYVTDSFGLLTTKLTIEGKSQEQALRFEDLEELKYYYEN